MENTLSLKEAQKAIILSQGIHNEDVAVTAKEATYKAIESINYVQIDSISVVERAHHHTLWNRTKNYSPTLLDQLLEDKRVFEYWSHAASYLPMTNYRYSLPRKYAFNKGELHWFNVDKKDMSFVLDRIKSDGPLQAKDFKDKSETKTGWWDWKPAKKALEQLFMQGDIMVDKRKGFQKVYDLTERVLPSNIDTSLPTEDEYFKHLIFNYLKANAIGTPTQITYLLKGIKKPVKQFCMQLIEDELLINIVVNKQTYFALPHLNNLLSKKITTNKVKILSPFDNLLIQRKRTKELFNFDYQIECYVPANKRKVGYFSLPLLWDQKFAGRMDVKMDRKLGVLNILNLHLEIESSDEFITALKKAMDKFLSFNKGENLNMVTVTSKIQTLTAHRVKHIKSVLTSSPS